MWNIIDSMYFKGKTALYSFLTDEKGEVNIVAIVVLIGIAILLAIIFKDRISALLSSLFDTIEENAEDVIS